MLSSNAYSSDDGVVAMVILMIAQEGQKHLWMELVMDDICERN